MDAHLALLLALTPDLSSLNMGINATREIAVLALLFKDATSKPESRLPPFKHLSFVCFYRRHYSRSSATQVPPFFHLPHNCLLSIIVEGQINGLWTENAPSPSKLVSLSLGPVGDEGLAQILAITDSLEGL